MRLAIPAESARGWASATHAVAQVSYQGSNPPVDSRVFRLRNRLRRVHRKSNLVGKEVARKIHQNGQPEPDIQALAAAERLSGDQQKGAEQAKQKSRFQSIRGRHIFKPEGLKSELSGTPKSKASLFIVCESGKRAHVSQIESSGRGLLQPLLSVGLSRLRSGGNGNALFESMLAFRIRIHHNR